MLYTVEYIRKVFKKMVIIPLVILVKKIVCLDANSQKTDTKWKAIIITVFIILYYVIHGRIYT